MQSPFSEAIPLPLCMLGNFAYFFYSADLFFKLTFFKRYFSLDPDAAKHLHNMDQNVLQKGWGWESSTYKSWLLFNKAQPGKMAI